MIFGQHQQDLYQYCEQHSSEQDPLLNELYRTTHLKVLKPRMASGPLQGRLLAMLSKMQQPQYIVEIGTFTGYATLCLAEGLVEHGKIITIEVNPELKYISQSFFDRSRWAGQIEQQIGDAKQLLPALPAGIDMAFIDAKKQDYHVYYELIIDKVKSGGLILADNILWDGKVLEPQQDKTTTAIHAFNSTILKDPRVESVILPLRDGLAVIRKK